MALLTPGAGAQPVRVTAAESIRPYGPAIERLLAQAGVATAIEYYPQARALAMIVSGESDVEVPRTRVAVEAIAKDVEMVGPLSCNEVVAWVRADSSFEFASVKDLARLSTAILIGDKFAQRLLADSGAVATPVASRDSMYRMLEAGRVDVVLDAEINGRLALKALKLGDRVRRVSAAMSTEPTFLVVRRRVPDLAPSLGKALQAMKQSGEWHRLIGDANAALDLPREFGLRCLGR